MTAITEKQYRDIAKKNNNWKFKQPDSDLEQYEKDSKHLKKKQNVLVKEDKDKNINKIAGQCSLLQTLFACDGNRSLYVSQT